VAVVARSVLARAEGPAGPCDRPRHSGSRHDRDRGTRRLIRPVSAGDVLVVGLPAWDATTAPGFRMPSDGRSLRLGGDD
jgi:hypothetical protein